MITSHFSYTLRAVDVFSPKNLHCRVYSMSHIAYSNVTRTSKWTPTILKTSAIPSSAENSSCQLIKHWKEPQFFCFGVEFGNWSGREYEVSIWKFKTQFKNIGPFWNRTKKINLRKTTHQHLNMQMSRREISYLNSDHQKSLSPEMTIKLDVTEVERSPRIFESRLE